MAKTLERHFADLRNYSFHRIPNAAAEGLNSAFQSILGNASGFGSFASIPILNQKVVQRHSEIGVSIAGRRYRSFLHPGLPLPLL